MKQLKIGSTLLTVSNVYPYRYDYGKGKEVLRIEVLEIDHSFEQLYQLNGNENIIQYFEDNTLKNNYEGYYQDFSCNYQDGVYSIELVRISATDLKVKELKAQMIPTIDTYTCTLEELKAWQINLSKNNLETYLYINPITSTCHGEIKKLYTITKDKQSLLTQMILMCQLAIQAGIEYQASWNAQGEICTYDWAITELQQLAFEIESVVRPLVSRQQTMEAEVKAATTKEEALAISIEF